MKITTLNIQAAALPRARQLLRWLDERDDDLLILTETSPGPGTVHLLNSARDAGWHVQAGAGTDRGCALLCRHPLQPATGLVNGVSLPHRAVAASLTADPATADPAVTVVGLYVPSNDRVRAARKRSFLTSVSAALAAVPSKLRGRLVVAGDFNLIPRDHRPPYPGVFTTGDYAFLDTLTALGLIDAHRHLHPGDQPHSWVGRRGHAYRYDYIHVGADLAPLLSASTYQHEVRLAGLSDHAAVSIEFALPTTHLPRAGGITDGVKDGQAVGPRTLPGSRPHAGASRRSG